MQANHNQADANAALGRRFFEEQDRLRGGPAPALCADSYVAVLGGNPPMPREGHEGFSRGFYAAFPDLSHNVEEVFATSERVAVRFILKGTHTGSFFGLPATSKPIIVSANVLMHVRDGKVTKLIGAFDEAGLLRQLGALPQ
jgi:predicted ester cyclase